MISEDIQKARQYLSDSGYDKQCKITTKETAKLLADYADKQVKLFALQVIKPN